MLRSIQHVCNFNDVITPHPHDYVASNMCATSTMSLHPTHPPNPTHVTGVKENAFIAPFTVGELRSETRRYVRLEPKTKPQVTNWDLSDMLMFVTLQQLLLNCKKNATPALS